MKRPDESSEEYMERMGGAIEIFPPRQEIPEIVVKNGERHLIADRALKVMYSAKVPLYRRGKFLLRIVRIKLKTSGGGEVMVPAVEQIDVTCLSRAMART